MKWPFAERLRTMTCLEKDVSTALIAIRDIVQGKLILLRSLVQLLLLYMTGQHDKMTPEIDRERETAVESLSYRLVSRLSVMCLAESQSPIGVTCVLL